MESKKFPKIEAALAARRPAGYRLAAMMVDGYGLNTKIVNEDSFDEHLANAINNGVEIDLKQFRSK